MPNDIEQQIAARVATERQRQAAAAQDAKNIQAQREQRQRQAELKDEAELLPALRAATTDMQGATVLKLLLAKWAAAHNGTITETKKGLFGRVTQQHKIVKSRMWESALPKIVPYSGGLLNHHKPVIRAKEGYRELAPGDITIQLGVSGKEFHVYFFGNGVVHITDNEYLYRTYNSLAELEEQLMRVLVDRELEDNRGTYWVIGLNALMYDISPDNPPPGML